MGLEPDFAAWLDRRDAEALARVFDATGGKLLLLAAHLAGGGAQAQDLVQAAFVAAMARGSTWDRTRPLWPWLAAILHNEARMQARSSRRRREVALDDDDGAAPHDGGDPQRLAASEEVLTAVLAAIDALPLPYRQVLRLRLVHGLRPVDIARSLEVPVGTVHAQLHRGLEHLRSVLPLGVAALISGLLAGENALLAQVKARVLDNAAVSSAAISGALIAGGWWTMNGKTIGAVLAGCVLLACLAFATGMPESWWPRAADASPAQPVRAELPLAAPDAPPPPSTGADRSTAVVANDAVWPLVVTVQTRDGTPIPGADVAVWTLPQGLAYWNGNELDMLREDVAAGVTSADGIFRSSLDGLRERSPLVHRTTQLWVEASWPHDRPRQQIVALPRTRDAQPVAVTIELERNRVITGRVVDDRGAAIAGAQVAPSNDRLLGSGVRTRSDGGFALEQDADSDRWPKRLVAVAAAHGTTTFDVPPRSADVGAVDVGTIVVASPNRVHGRAVLGDASALAGVELHLHALDPSLGDDLKKIHRWLMRDGVTHHQSLAMRDGRVVVNDARTTTAADGSFCFAGLEADGVYLLCMEAVGAPADTVVRPGGDPIELRIDKQVLTIDVVDENGATLPGAHVRIDVYDPASTNPAWDKRPGFPEHGQVLGNGSPFAALDGKRTFLTPFGFVLCLSAADDCMQPVAVRYEAVRGVYRATCRVDVRAQTAFGKLHIVAVDENGAPLHFEPTVTSLDRRLQFGGRRMVMPPEGWTQEVPAGSWRVEAVLGKELVQTYEMAGCARGCQEHVVMVEDGKTTELKLTAPPAGLVAFDVTCNKAAIKSPHKLRVEEAGRAVVVLAHDPNDWVLRFQGGARSTRFLAKQAFAPGRHSFLLQAEGYQPATCEVDVVVDKLVHVKVELFPR